VDKDNLRSTLHDFIVSEILFRETPLAPDEDLFDAGFDSLSLSRLLVFVEERFGVNIPEEEVVIDEIATIDTMATFVAGYLARS